MATQNHKSGDDTYGSALQRVMKECLPPILVEIADRRPADPIQYLAQSLYEFRKKEDKELPDMMPSQLTREQTDKLQDNVLQKDFTSKGMIVENSTSQQDDFIEEDYYETTFISKNMVHENCMPMIKQIGDIFDEQDLT